MANKFQSEKLPVIKVIKIGKSFPILLDSLKMPGSEQTGINHLSGFKVSAKARHESLNG